MKTKTGEALRWLYNISNNEIGNDCLIWPYAKDRRTGYGIVIFHKQTRTAHRVALILHTEVDPKDKQASHGPCHNRLCCNPLHLSWKSVEDNHYDKIRDNTHNRGQRHYLSKLTPEKVIDIRADERMHKIIAEEYGVSRSVISGIKSNLSWNWVK